MKRVLFVFGTRPEAIKLAPLIKEMQKYPNDFVVRICVTGQHREMLYQVLDFFEIKPDYDLEIMEPNQALFTITAKIIKRIGPILEKEKPDLVFVQGDTTTVFMGALGAFYNQIPVAHLEAGLRTSDIYSPFPEELNRVMVSRIAKYHFTPTIQAAENLLKEGVGSKSIYNVGNTVIDALFLTKKLISRDKNKYANKFASIDFLKKIILVTSHRRESIGEGFANICTAIRMIAENNNVEIVFPIHYSPAIRDAAEKEGLYEVKNIYIIDPLDYPDLVYLMEKSYLVLTDSGGIQEEAPSLGRPVLVMRDTTERPEGIKAGVAKLVGTDKKVIIDEVEKLLNNHDQYNKMANAINPYGNGTASKKIIDILK